MKLIQRILHVVRHYRQIKCQEKFWKAEITRCVGHFTTYVRLQQWDEAVKWCLRIQIARHRMNVEVLVPMGRPLLEVRRKTDFTKA